MLPAIAAKQCIKLDILVTSLVYFAQFATYSFLYIIYSADFEDITRSPLKGYRSEIRF